MENKQLNPQSTPAPHPTVLAVNSDQMIRVYCITPITNENDILNALNF